MGNVFFRSRPTRIGGDELRRRLAAALRDGLPGWTVSLHVPDAGPPVVSWTDGPAGSRVADVVGTVVNWEVRTVPAPPARAADPAVLLDRRFSDLAVAVAVVRYRASNVRPYDSSDPAAVARLSALLDIDDPARSGYPVPDAMAALLLDADAPTPPAAAAGASPADRLAAKLEAVGFDALWRVAWSAVD